jgi:hypothetical protein
MAHINGYVFGNGPAFPAYEGENVVWYFMSIQRGIHTVHISGQTMEIENLRFYFITNSLTCISRNLSKIRPGNIQKSAVTYSVIQLYRMQLRREKSILFTFNLF